MTDAYANGQAIVRKAGDGKVIAAFPDVCMSPPSPPAGPIPVPYPNSSFSKDLRQGSKTVQIDGKEVALRDKSYYATSPLGNEAATKTLGAGMVTHGITGKTFFRAWSMDVKAEGQNVVRHLDLTTSNHSSDPANNSLPAINAEKSNLASTEETAQAELPKCDCCGKPAHSKAQAEGKEMTEQEFYSPRPDKGTPPKFAIDAANFLKEVRNGPCKGLLPPANPSSRTKCNKYYITTTIEKRRIEATWNAYRSRYYRWSGVVPGTTIGHRVPKSAGGCPTGPGNLTPVTQECEAVEDRLSELQKKATDYHRKRLGLA